MRALARVKIARRRIESIRARHGTKDWMVKRRERTRQLIELGGLVVKSGLVDVLDDDRSAIFGALLEQFARIQIEDATALRLLWARRGRRGFANGEDA